MKVLRIVFLVILIFIFTCTQSFTDLMYKGIIGFRFNSDPNFMEMLQFRLTDLMNEHYIIQKIGHFSSFGILAGFIYSWLKKYRLALLVAISYAVSTEILQLFFFRDGRIVDMFIDTAGVVTALLLIIIKKQVDIEAVKSAK
ncbi:VanZ family protein [Falsibacillus pallidus]|uniref:VanZ family protein n=1 Tax=Falsibacillus pallidus TaxID=493781 RepID=UPI003D96FCDC